MDINETVSAQRRFWNTGATRSVAARRARLDALERAILSHEGDICAALKADLNKAPFESYACEIGIVLSELRYARAHLFRWAAPQLRPTPLALFPATSRILAEPYGVALIMSPWNYPIQLTLVPLISAVAAGNCAVVKPSAYAPNCSQAVADILSEAFPAEWVTAVQGGRAQNYALLEQKFDYIFFTGSIEVGKSVMTAAARNLTPVTLELGGKAPAIITPGASLRAAARRIAWGKCLNAGQTCVAPDHVYVPEPLRDEFVAELAHQITLMYGEDPLQSPDLPKIITPRHFERIAGLLEGTHVAVGGRANGVERKIEPTVLIDVEEQDPVMQQEIFGPILPVLTYQDLGELLSRQQRKPRPLALYVFTASRALERQIVQAIPSGGVCVNDTVVHLANHHVPFGGVGLSGMGSCHGKAGFDTFTHYRTVVRRGSLDVPLRYPPHAGKNLTLLKRLMK